MVKVGEKQYCVARKNAKLKHESELEFELYVKIVEVSIIKGERIKIKGDRVRRNEEWQLRYRDVYVRFFFEE